MTALKTLWVLVLVLGGPNAPPPQISWHATQFECAVAGIGEQLRWQMMNRVVESVICQERAVEELQRLPPVVPGGRSQPYVLSNEQ